MKVGIEFDDVIVSGETKRLIEGFNTGIDFKQRKSCDEYYPSVNNHADINLEELSLISERLVVLVEPNTIRLSERY